MDRRASVGISGPGAGLEDEGEGVLVGVEAERRQGAVQLDSFGWVVGSGVAAEHGVEEEGGGGGGGGEDGSGGVWVVEG